MGSRIPGFYRVPPDQRLVLLEQEGAIEASDYRDGGLTVADAELMVENVIATLAIPSAVALNFRINDEDRLIPMAVEEPSVVAAVSNMARLVRDAGGFTADSDPSVMIGQIQLLEVADPVACVARLEAALPHLADVAEAVHPRITARGGGFRGFAVRHVVYDEPGAPREDMVVLHVHLDCVDAMGANLINTVCEHLAPHVEAATGETVGLRILSNLADRRLARARVAIPPSLLGTDDMDGALVAARIVSAWRFAWADPYRAATHNKGVMNGIDAVAVATGNDWRAIEAGVHAFAARDGHYRPVTRWCIADDGTLVGTLEVPLQLGTVGGPIRVHPTVQANLRMLQTRGARDLAAVAAAVGLAQNLGALRALATEGIQAGHMRMHARTVAAAAGANRDEIDAVTAVLCEHGDFSVDRATRALESIRRG